MRRKKNNTPKSKTAQKQLVNELITCLTEVIVLVLVIYQINTTKHLLTFHCCISFIKISAIRPAGQISKHLITYNGYRAATNDYFRNWIVWWLFFSELFHYWNDGNTFTHRTEKSSKFSHLRIVDLFSVNQLIVSGLNVFVMFGSSEMIDWLEKYPLD